MALNLTVLSEPAHGQPGQLLLLDIDTEKLFLYTLDLLIQSPYELFLPGRLRMERARRLIELAVIYSL